MYIYSLNSRQKLLAFQRPLSALNQVSLVPFKLILVFVAIGIQMCSFPLLHAAPLPEPGHHFPVPRR